MEICKRMMESSVRLASIRYHDLVDQDESDTCS